MKRLLTGFCAAALCAVAVMACMACKDVSGSSGEIPRQDQASLLGKVVILQAYGTGNKDDGGVSHSFIELYNKSGEIAILDGCSLQYSAGGTTWRVINLAGKSIPPGRSFLVVGQKMNNRNDQAGTGLLQLDPSRADISLPNLQIDNNQFKIFFVESVQPVSVKNPFDSLGNSSGVKTAGYIDLLGVNDTDISKNIDAFETSRLSDSTVKAPYYASKGKSVRRITLNDTDDNGRDFERIEWRSGQSESISAAEFERFRPRSTMDGQWYPIYVRTPSGASNANIGTLRIAGQTSNPGMPAGSYNAVTSPGAASITNLVAGSAPVELTIAPGATFRTAKASGSGAPQWSDFVSPVYSFANGDFLYISVRSANGTVENVYKVLVSVTAAGGTVTVGGSYTLSLNSTIPRQRVSIEAYTSQAATELAARTDAVLASGTSTSGTWTMVIPAGQPLWFRLAVTDTTGYSFGRVVSNSAQAFYTSTPNIALALGGFALPSLNSFELINATAQSGNKQNKTGSIDQASGVIAMPETSYSTVAVGTIIDYHKLVANFTVSQGNKIYADGVEQISGVTQNNYYQPVTFTVVAEDNARKNYTVAGLSNQRVAGTQSFQTRGFGMINITTTDTTLGMPANVPGYDQAAKLNMAWNTTGSFTYLGPEGRVVSGGTAIKGHGNYSVRYAGNKSYSLKLNTAAGFDYYDYKTQRYVTLPAHKRWVLLAHDGDGTRIRTTLGFEMGRHVLTNMGWQPRADWVYFFLNDKFMGIYILAEVIKIDEGRMNIGNEASLSNPTGSFIVELNNTNWYGNDIMHQNNQFIFDDMYNFMSGHQNPVRNTSGNAGNSGALKQQGAAFSFSSPDENLGWYYQDPPLSDGNINYSNTTHFPRKGIVLAARLSDGFVYNRASKPVNEWTVPDDFGQPNGMGTSGMMQAGNFAQNNGGVYGSRTLGSVYQNYAASAFVKMAQIIQTAEDAVYAHNYGNNGIGGYHQYIDIDSFIDWQIAQEMTSNWEVIALNGQFMYYDSRIQKFKMGPVWDLDNGWNNNDNDANPGFVAKAPFWYKELLGWEMDNSQNLGGQTLNDRKDAYYVSRLKARWEAVRNKFNEQLDPYIDLTNERFTRLDAYNFNNPFGVGGDRTGFKSKLSSRRDALDTVIRGY